MNPVHKRVVDQVSKIFRRRGGKMKTDDSADFRKKGHIRLRLPHYIITQLELGNVFRGV